MRYCFDVDGTICHTKGTDYYGSVPDKKMIALIRELYRDGHYIIIMTARGTGSGVDCHTFTKYQLSSWGVYFHELISGKPVADVYVDDKGMTPEEFLEARPGLR